MMSNFSFSFADTYSTVIPTDTSITSPVNGNNGSVNYYYYSIANGVVTTPYDEAYAAYAVIGNTNYYIFFGFANFRIGYIRGSGNVSTLNTTINSENYDGTYFYYTTDTFNNLASYNGVASIGSFTSISDAVDYIYNHYSEITNTSSEDGNVFKFTLTNGWLSVIDLGSSGSSYDIDLSTQFATYSKFTSPYWDSTQRYWFTNIMPEVGDSFTNSDTGTLITWTKSGSTDIFGRSKGAVANISGTSTGKYLVIYNPAYYSWSSILQGNAPHDEANSPVLVDGIKEGQEITLFKMDETMHLLQGVTSSFIKLSGSTTAEGDNKDLTDTFTDSEGNPLVQNSGGGNDLHESSGIVGYIMNINDVLDNFTNNVLSLLSAPISHIHQLISGAGNFLGSIQTMFTWLPPEVYNACITAALLCIIIGIFKMFL